MPFRVLISRPVVLSALACGMLAGISVLRFEVTQPGIMLLAIIPIALLGVMYGVGGGMAGAIVATAVFLVWAFSRGHPGVIEEIDEPGVFLMLGLLTGIYVHGELGDLNPRRALERAELRRGMQRGEVVFHYQPVAEARSRRIVGFEALARWEHPVHGQLPPARFIPLAESDERTIWALTLLAVDRALSSLSQWGERAGQVTISVNLSPANLGRRDLATEFSRLLVKHEIPPSRLAIEITETALLEAPQAAANALDSLKRLGVSIVLDDFGTGHSSITRLGRLPFDTLKVDLDLIGLPPARDANRILGAMIELAQALGLQVVAERVEDDHTWEEVSRMGCDLVQGFRLCPPLPPEHVREWLADPEHAPALT